MKLMIVDDHVLIREGLAAIIKSEPDMEIIGLAGNVSEAVEMANRSTPDIILMDFSLPDGTGLDATRSILALHPTCKIIFLTIHEEDEKLFSAIRAGAKGYLLKNVSPKKLVASIRAVQQGEGVLSDGMTSRLMTELARGQASPVEASNGPLSKLTRRELDVLRELAAGATNEEISRSLFLTENTVKHHLHSIYNKLNIANRREAEKIARENGLVAPRKKD